MLNGALLHLEDPARVSRMQTSLLGILQSQISARTRKPDLEPYRSQLSEEFRGEFEDSLAAHLFGSGALVSYRLKWVLATHCQVRPTS